jgi:hypothetical protein
MTEPLAVGVGDDQAGGGAGDVDAPAVVQAVVVRAEQGQIDQLGDATILPMPNVMSLQAAGGPAAGDRAASVAVFQGAA